MHHDDHHREIDSQVENSVCVKLKRNQLVEIGEVNKYKLDSARQKNKEKECERMFCQVK